MVLGDENKDLLLLLFKLLNTKVRNELLLEITFEPFHLGQNISPTLYCPGNVDSSPLSSGSSL